MPPKFMARKANKMKGDYFSVKDYEADGLKSKPLNEAAIMYNHYNEHKDDNEEMA